MNDNLKFTGTQINYYFVCHRKLWLFSRGLSMEHNSDIVYMGKLIGEEAFDREKKELLIDDLIAIDFVGADGVIHEVKKSDSMDQADEFQVLYYLFYLRQKGIDNISGEINYPKLRKKVSIEWSDENEQRLRDVMVGIENILTLLSPPGRKKVSFCKKCSYYELCWVE
jgi:CRISPR-associated exonuclease Cas4